MYQGRRTIALIAGARPNFMKIAPIMRAIGRHAGELRSVLIHTGQHYDEKMSGTFFGELGIRMPDHALGVGSGTHATQTAAAMVALEKVFEAEQPDVVVVVGDVNSTLAAAVVAKKLHIELAHVEAGLRSRDREMPEEINRLVTDSISDLLFTTEPEAGANLRAEGHAEESIHYVGHVMIDNLLYQAAKLDSQGVVGPGALRSRLTGAYAVVTLHRPSNVDQPETLRGIVGALQEVGERVPVLFPCHPRTARQLVATGLASVFREVGDGTESLSPGCYLCEPLGYNDFLRLWKDASVALTDSGGLQEETTALGVPCITLRHNTERPITVEVGTNVVAGTDPERIVLLARKALDGRWKKGGVPEFWDGRASERIVDVIRGMGKSFTTEDTEGTERGKREG